MFDYALLSCLRLRGLGHGGARRSRPCGLLQRQPPVSPIVSQLTGHVDHPPRHHQAADRPTQQRCAVCNLPTLFLDRSCSARRAWVRLGYPHALLHPAAFHPYPMQTASMTPPSGAFLRIHHLSTLPKSQASAHQRCLHVPSWPGICLPRCNSQCTRQGGSAERRSLAAPLCRQSVPAQHAAPRSRALCWRHADEVTREGAAGASRMFVRACSHAQPTSDLV